MNLENTEIHSIRERSEFHSLFVDKVVQNISTVDLENTDIHSEREGLVIRLDGISIDTDRVDIEIN